MLAPASASQRILTDTYRGTRLLDLEIIDYIASTKERWGREQLRLRRRAITLIVPDPAKVVTVPLGI